MRYYLMSDARARSLAKDLASLAAEAGNKVPLTKAQAAVAKMLGYTDWKDLQSNIGSSETAGPEDGGLTAIEVAARREMQSAALGDIGIPESDHALMLARLRPTSRADAEAAPAREFIQRPYDMRYHPDRMKDAWFRLCEHCEATEREFEGYYYEVMDILREWGEGRRLGDLDRLLVEDSGDDTATFLEKAMEDPYKWGFVIDASGLPDLECGKLLDRTFPHFGKDMKSAAIFVHLGRNAFPSPYGGEGAEGVYLEIDVDDTLEEEDGNPINIQATVVCSEPEYPMDHGDMGITINSALRLRNNLRHGYTAFYAWGEQDLERQIDYSLGETDYDDSRKWAPFIAAPIRAALNAAHLCFGRLTPVHDAVPRLAPYERTHFERSTTEKQFRKVAGSLGEERLCVRFLGERPDLKKTSVRDTFSFHKPHLASAEDVQIAIDDSFDFSSADAAAEFMRSVMQIASERRDRSPEDFQAWIRSCAALLQAQLHAGDFGSALRSASAMDEISEDHPEMKPYLPLAWLAMELAGHHGVSGSLEAKLDPDVCEDSITAVRKIRELLGEPNSAGNLLENGAQRPFMIQFIESMSLGGKADPEYSEEWNYGHYAAHETQMWRNEVLAGSRPK
ncbi:hypothetical protein [Rhizobium leguminosarum]|uniref:hypothetical protein n=1 Tax=Rhizobium leguminosarum TaxID=384 RepID=UPI002E163E6B|nr:hypothetical protein U8Q02_38330 [Rhizobium leguminosarum]